MTALPPPLRTPLRIVSLVPSWTATLCDLGLASHLVGCTSFCTWPKGLRRTHPQIEVVGGTKDARFESIAALRPTHIITNDEENKPELIAQLERELPVPSACVVRTLPKTPDEAVADTIRIAETLGAPTERLQNCLNAIAHAREALAHEVRLDSNSGHASGLHAPTCAYFIWMKPWMVAGNQTYISALLSAAGFQNLISTGSDMRERYPQVKTEEPTHHTALSQPGAWFLFSSEPFAFRERHLDAFARDWGVPRDHCLRVDGQALSWYGNFLAKGYDELRRIRRIIKEQSQKESHENS